MLIEAVVATGIALVILVGTTTGFTYLYRAAIANTAKVQAAFLAEEGLEAARIIRDNAWSTIASQTSGSTTRLYFNGTSWISTSTNTYIDNTFERAVVFTDVYRDANKDIVSSGTLDANTKRVDVIISWRDHGATTSLSLSTYLANVFNE